MSLPGSEPPASDFGIKSFGMLHLSCNTICVSLIINIRINNTPRIDFILCLGQMISHGGFFRLSPTRERNVSPSSGTQPLCRPLDQRGLRVLWTERGHRVGSIGETPQGVGEDLAG